MTIILHASDLHFGKTNPEIVSRLLHDILERKPDIVVLSGDFTQDGQSREFIGARDFIAQIPGPVFTVPGNHDIARFSVAERFLHPYKRYRQYINDDLNPVYEYKNCLIVGVNTARPAVPHWNWAHGMISEAQIVQAEKAFQKARPEQCRIFVCHHPLMAAADAPLDTIVWRGKELTRMLFRQNVELVLTGHVHHASVTLANDHEGQLASVGASTATSTRLRHHANGYNILEITARKIEIDLQHWENGKFVSLQKHAIERGHFKPSPDKAQPEPENGPNTLSSPAS
jgi:3',5'-cyclic AMP phosphodiesterase CpdA